MSEESKFCSNCKKNVAARNYTVHVVHCTRNICLCSVCGEPVPRSQFQQHLQAVHSTVDCSKCAKKIEAADIYAHEHEQCPRRLVSCQFCELEVLASELQKHTDYCGARTERCKGCTKYVQCRHLQFHYSSDHKYLTPEDKGQDGCESGDESGDECPVCLGTITLPLALECGHVFCMVCVKGIANTTKNCAICRRDIARDMLMDIRFCREEDIIKNYVNKPRDSKKNFRSHSVPSRVQPASTARRVTTQDYDDMVSHLLSNRTSSTPYRYQRPNNSHTPASYTPYSYTSNTSTNNTNTNTTNSSNNDDDCCCSSSSQSASGVASPAAAPSSTAVSAAPAAAAAPQAPPAFQPAAASPVAPPRTSATTAASASSSPASSEAKPRRPTSLALSSSLNDSNNSENQRDRRGPPVNATQEQYDRWLAFQLAKTEDDVSAAEFNKKHRPVIGRSQSMPEREIVSATHRAAAAAAAAASSDTDSSDEDEEDTSSPVNRNTSSPYSRPPASPRNNTSSSHQTSAPLNSSSLSGGGVNSSSSISSSSSSSSRSPSLTKSSSDSNNNATGGSSSSSSGGGSRSITNTTGTRPKSSTGLKKRVSFKEEAPEERRVAPIMLPCEFCDEMFPERDLMRHQTSCDLNETQMPRARRDSITSPPLLNSPSALSRTSSSSAPSSNLGSPVSPTSRRKIPPNLPLGASSKRTSDINRSSLDNHRTPPTSPPPRPPHGPYSANHQTNNSNIINRIRSSPQPNSNELADSSSDSRPTSVSPCPPHSNNSYSSGISSMASSTRSVSSTPSSSSSASPIPAIVDTPTDIEADFEDDDTPFVKPRRGKLLSSAICSWRSMSGNSRDRPRYTRSNTAPLEDTGEDNPELNPVINSHSASQLPPLPPRPESTPAESDQSSPDFPSTTNLPQPQRPKSAQVFIKRQKKYRAPPPPSHNNTHNNTTYNSNRNNSKATESESHVYHGAPTASESTNHVHDQPASSFFRLDSKPMMNSEAQDGVELSVSCEFCQQSFSSEKFQHHKTVCEMSPSNKVETFRVGGQGRAPSPLDNTTSPPPHQPGSSHSSDSQDQPAHSSVQLRRYERAQSVLDDRCLAASRESRLQRTNSIKDGSRSRPAADSSMGRRWSSRETLFCQRGESPATVSPGANYAGSSIAGGKYSSRGWSDHVSMVQDDVKAKLTSAKALLYEREKKSENPEADALRPNFLGDLRFWLDKTNQTSSPPTLGSSRYRSSSVARPSIYSSSSGYGGSSTRLNSLDYRSPYDSSASPRTPFSNTDSFGSAFRRRYVR